jgi:peptidoglycan/xylan/chitin deacetylase (PgdA/CDA1 family)
MYKGLQQIDYRLVGWGWGLWDWNWFRARDADALARRLARKASAGDIIVMHDGHHVDPAPDRRYAIEAARQLVPALKARGYELATLC